LSKAEPSGGVFLKSDHIGMKSAMADFIPQLAKKVRTEFLTFDSPEREGAKRRKHG
jgi:hypothetical protein